MEQSELKFDFPFEDGMPVEKILARAESEEVGEAPSKEPHIYTISELTSSIRDILEKSYPDVWVVGEVSNFRCPNQTHYYFSLKDESCQLRAAFFGGRQKTQFAIEDGLELICHGKISVYNARGEYQITVDYCEPKGKGALQLAFEQLKKRLEAEGLFASARKRPIPFLPKKIGVVTSPTGAAIRDIINILTRRFPNIDILLIPVKVQGEGAAEEIADAVGEMNKLSDIDVMIVGRGGGSLEDLWAFNEEVVARAIFASKIPVISAVGHEIDFTIADFVADMRAPTPSAAAELVVPKKTDLISQITNLKRGLFYAIKKDLETRWDAVKNLRGRISDPSGRLNDLVRRLDDMVERLHFVIGSYISAKQKELIKLKSNLKHLSPFHILEKGYAIVTKGRALNPIKSSRLLKKGEDLNIRFHEGQAAAKITKVN